MQTQLSALARSVADVATPKAEAYLMQLCLHFGHKLPVEREQTIGKIGFPLGDCRLQATAGTLHLALESADAERLAQLQDVVARHLLRFAFREEMQIDWHAA